MFTSLLIARSSLLSIVAVPVIAMSICPLSKKEKTEADVCAHMMKLGEAAGETVKPGDDAKCEEQLTEQMATCANRKAAIDCYLGVSKKEDVSGCSAMCKSDSETESSGAGSGKIACINACQSKHGPLIDTSKTKECAQKHSGYGKEAERKACMASATNSATSSCMKDCK